MLQDRLSERYVTTLGAVFALAVGAAVLVAILRIRERRALRYSTLSVWLLLMAGQILIWSRPSAEVSAVERMHFVFYSLVAALFCRAFRSNGDSSTLLMALVAAVMVGILDEGMQWLVPVRAADFIDIGINAYGSFSGLWLGVALWPPHRLSWRMAPPSLSRTSRLAAALLVLLGVYIHVAHLGYVIDDPEIGRFRSFFTTAELENLKVSRAQRWAEHPPGPPDDLSSTEIEDYYRTEGGWRVHWLTRALRRKDYYIAWKENQILEKYFTPFLDLPNDYGGIFRLSAADLKRIEERRPEVEPYPYVSPVGVFPRYAIWLRPTRLELWAGIAILAALCLATPMLLARRE